MSAPIKIVIRADAGPSVGTGHFARTSAVAENLSAAGDIEVLLLTNAEGAALASGFFPADTRIVPLAPDATGPEGAMRTLTQLEWLPDVIIIDQYGSVPEWETLAASKGTPIFVFDDFDVASRADLIVRPHGGSGSAREKIVLRGPEYLPLSRHITELAKRSFKEGRERLRMNICFGGSDPTGETAKALQAAAMLKELAVDVVIGPGARIDPALLTTSEQISHITLYRAPSQEKLAMIMSEADLALGAGGVMLWERLFLSVPSIVISVARNQLPQIEKMVEAGAIQFLGEHAEVTPDKIVQAVTALAADEARRKTIAETGRELIDGRGALRLASWIRALALDTREAKKEDAKNILNWRTDDQNWLHNFETAPKPSFNAHMSWFAAKLAHPDCIFRIVTRQKEPVGVVRFDINNEDRSAYLSIYLVPEWHGRKMGLPVYLAAERELRRFHPRVDKIVSRIHKANAASERLHRDAGFEISASPDHMDWLDGWKLLD